MKIKLIMPLVICAIACLSSPRSEAGDTTIEKMPAELETRFALSALPPKLRDRLRCFCSIRQGHSPQSDGEWLEMMPLQVECAAGRL